MHNNYKNPKITHSGDTSIQLPNHSPLGSYSAKKAIKGQDIGKKGKMFAKIEAQGNKRYGAGHGAKIAGAVLKKLRHKR